MALQNPAEGTYVPRNITGHDLDNVVVEALVAAAGLSPETVTHEDFRALLPSARLIGRTGEATPYANVMLRSGVSF